MGLADLHMHTLYSYDGTASVEAVLRRAKQVGLNVIAITDHDEIRGALAALDLASRFDIEVIPGIEITTSEGDLLALNVHKIIPAGQPLVDTLLQVGEAGGFAIAPHPMAGGLGMKSLNGYSIRRARQHAEAGKILWAIETYNGTMLDREGNHFALNLAQKLNLTQTGSSDAHVLEMIGYGRTFFEGDTCADLCTALQAGTTQVRTGPVVSLMQVFGRWAWDYLKSTPARLNPAFS
jgi:hypothetical protein